MDIVIRTTAGQAERLTAALVADYLRAHPRAVLGCATGRTFEPVYAMLAAMHAEGGLNFRGVTTFNLDEYVGLDQADRRSFRAYMVEHLFSKVDIAAENAHLPDASAPDLAAECRAYEQAIQDAGGIGLQLLGIGLTGHIGFNEPGSALQSRTRTKALSELTRRQNAESFGGVENVPLRAITMGIGTILDARTCLLLATGEAKAQVVADALEGPVSASVPASALQFHPDCAVVLDEAAASRLKNTSYYVSTYEREPEWAPYRERGL